ncbi:MAG: DUF1724 domain-containing protein, partial [Methanospirillum sp.]|nr:DUF1724 domain-containing protein [Methanospirillum sp.]
RILLRIFESGPQSLDEIKNELKVPTTSILPQLRILEEHDLIRKSNKKFMLTVIGTITTEKLVSLVRITDVLDKNLQYWHTHAIESLPPEFILRISDLGNYTIASSDPPHTFIPKRKFHEQMEKTSFFRGMSATIHPDHLVVYLHLAREGRDISHVTTKKAYDTLIARYPDEMKELSGLMHDGFIISPVDFEWECVVTDDTLFLSLFLKSGAVDPNYDLISADESARRWGSDLYQYFASKGVPV